MPEAGYTKSKYDLTNARVLKVPQSIFQRLYATHGIRWAEKSRDALYEFAAEPAVEG